MTMFRYQYPKWPGEMAGAEIVTNSGTFDFELEEVIAQLVDNQVRAAKGNFQQWPAQKAANSALVEIINRLKQPDLLEHKVVVWKHPTRNWSVQELERESWRWKSALSKWSNSNSAAFIAPIVVAFNPEAALKEEQPTEFDGSIKPEAFLPDSIFGENLNWLIYSKRFIRVSCPICEISYSPAKCGIEKWELNQGSSYQGEKIICPKSHTLHGRCTCVSEYFPMKI